MFRTNFLTLAIGTMFVSFPVFGIGQVFEGKNGYRLQVEFVQEPPCPVSIRVANVNLDTEPQAQNINLAINNQSLKPIRAYAMVSGGSRYPTVHTWTFPASPFNPNQTLLRGVWPNSQDHYYFFFDYILFADGTSCGYDNHHRSVQIGRYLESHASAMTRLRELAWAYSNGDKVIESLESVTEGGFSHDMAGPPNPETIKLAPLRAYEHLVARLRNLGDKRKDMAVTARQIASRLESEIPVLFPVERGKQSTRQ